MTCHSQNETQKGSIWEHRWLAFKKGTCSDKPIETSPLVVSYSCDFTLGRPYNASQSQGILFRPHGIRVRGIATITGGAPQYYCTIIMPSYPISLAGLKSLFFIILATVCVRQSLSAY